MSTTLQTNLFNTGTTQVYSPGTSAGIVPSTGLPGFADGSSAATGTTGERIISYVNGTGASVPAGSGVVITQITITPGRWRIDGGGGGNPSNASGAVICAINNTSATIGNPLTNYYESLLSGNPSGYGVQMAAPSQFVSVSTNTVYYLLVEVIGVSMSNTSAYIAATRQ